MMSPSWTCTILLLVSICGRLADARVRPFVPPPQYILDAEKIQLPPKAFALPVIGTELPRDGWTATADSTQDGNPAGNVVDGDTASIWHSEWAPDESQLPHTITIDMGTVNVLNGISYLPRQDGNPNGNIGEHQVFTSLDGDDFALAAFGTWLDDDTEKSADFENTPARFIRIVALSEAGNRGPFTNAAEIKAYGVQSFVSRDGWTASADSVQDVFVPGNVLDGDASTYWHTQWSDPVAELPHTLTIDMKSTLLVDAVSYTPRQDGNPNGNIGDFEISVSDDGDNFNQVASGTWADDSTMKLTSFEPAQAKFIRITANSEAGNRGPWSSAAEINVSSGDDDGNIPPLPNGKGKWGPTINFPLVPVAASVQPGTGKVVAWSAWSPSEFSDNLHQTVTAMYDPATQKVTGRVVSNTGHDMFCPGISIDADGRTLVTGGDTAQRASLYTPETDSWSSAADMILQRGYQSSATCSDGRIFTIGGSWSGPLGGKNGEIYSPKEDIWTMLNGCPVEPMLTDDSDGIWRQDNHGWLFGWKDGSVFQAGPSTAMNWYGTGGDGSQDAAGTRADDAHSMCGNAVMYDAIDGKILTVGGSPDYQNKGASTAAHLITIGNPGSAPEVTVLDGMSFPRIFHNSVVLPDGTVFITGGQSIGNPFVDSNVEFTPEIWDPTTNEFTQLVPNSTPRVYHSFALLLEDATVISGGGGLCGSCSTNHYDAQVYTPQYLLNDDGSESPRPSITAVSTDEVVPGDSITVDTDSAVEAMSLVRYGSATHTVNTDQRRIPLAITSVGTNSYEFTVPGDYGIALPGYWMLFAIDADGHPSVASTIKIRGA